MGGGPVGAGGLTASAGGREGCAGGWLAQALTRTARRAIAPDRVIGVISAAPVRALYHERGWRPSTRAETGGERVFGCAETQCRRRLGVRGFARASWRPRSART